MRTMGIVAIYPKKNLSQPNQAHRVYPHLLRNLNIDRPNQVWATYITYLPMARGFYYLAAVIDWYSRRVLSWRLSNTLDSQFCVDAMEDAIAKYGVPDPGPGNGISHVSLYQVDFVLLQVTIRSQSIR